ncbi:MAG: metalloregulator ArsR/SmtB family transcription factor, partial [Pseudomonadota bacterium]|nr:metalloregulator ArsR/SmtB family transcription factor [Pseudomonadota bacterium]
MTNVGELPFSDTLSETSAVLKVLGDELRLQIFAILNEQSYSVQELCQLFDVRQPNMSHHLKLLNEQGLIA